VTFLERDGTLVLGKIREHSNPKRFNDTHKKFQLALNVYLLSATIHALTVGPSACQLINHPEANKMGSGSTRHHTRSFPILPMYRDTAGNATDEWSKRKYSSPMIRIVLAVTTPSVLKMMQERIVRMVVNMEVSLLLRT
jgi:hypothetical protein